MSDTGDFYLEALLNFLQSDDWKDTIRIFIVANCQYFSHIADYHTQQHVLWVSFQDIVENILQMALSSVGGSLEDLEHAMDRVLQRPSRGPKDANIQDLLEQLQTCHDFDYFAQMMRKACQDMYQEEGKHIDENPYDMLMRMGFTAALIDRAYDDLGKHASLEDIILFLSAENEANTSGDHSTHSATHPKVKKGKKGTKTRGGQEEKNIQISTENEENLQNIENALFEPYHKFIIEASSFDIHNIDVNELNAKFVIADSVLASYRESMKGQVVKNGDGGGGKNGEGGVNNGGTDEMLDLVQWAADMKTLQQDILQAYEQEIHSKDMIYNHAKGLIHWYVELETMRQEINQRSNHVAGDMLSDTELTRMAELDRIAMQGSEDEQKLHHLLSRHELVRQEITKLYQKIAIIIGMNHKIQRNLVEEVYLFLKEQVGNNQRLEDLFMQANTQVGSNGSSEEAIAKLMSFQGGLEIINHFFDLHLLEEEQQYLRHEINQLLGSPVAHHGSDGGHKASNDLFGDAGSSAGHFEEMFHQLDHPNNDAKLAMDDAKHTLDDAKLSADDAKHIADVAEEKKLSHAQSLLLLNAAPVNASESLIEKLKTSHRNALDTLKATLEANKNQQLQQLETRLLMRKKKLQGLVAEGDPVANRFQIEEEEAVIELLSAEMKSYLAHHEQKKDDLVEGLKYKCMNELKAARAILKESPANVDEETLSRQLQSKLSKQQSQINQDALLGLKERYEYDKTQLLSHFQQERQRQHQRLQTRLDKKRNLAAGSAIGTAGNSNGLIDEDEEFNYELKQMDMKLDRELNHALTGLRESLLLGLGGVTVLAEDGDGSEDRIKPIKKKSLQLDGEDDDYLDDPQERLLKNNKHLLNNITRLEEMKKMYTEAGDQLQRDLFTKRYNKGRKPNRPGVDGIASQEEESEYRQLVQIVDDVIVQAFDSHVLDMSSALQGKDGDDDAGRSFSLKASSRRDDNAGAVDKKALEERMKAGILDAFEKAKGNLQDSQLNDKQKAMQKLQQRREQHQNRPSGSTSALMESMLDEVMESYLEGGSVAKKADIEASVQVQVMSSNSNNARTLAQISPSKSKKNFEDEKSRIVDIHHQKEKQLVDDLYSTMLDKKRKLEDRMRRKKEKMEHEVEANVADAKQETSGSMSMQNVEEDEDKKKIDMLEAAFHKVVATLKHATLDNMTPDQLIGMMERFAQPAPEAAVVKSESHSTTHSRPVSAGHEREAMVGEARRISTAYVEEQQKHDLMMKIQQARQKQLLQRKLWERNQARQQQMQVENLDEDDDEDDDDHQSTDTSIHIGQYQSRLKNLKPYSNQPAFKMPNMPSVAEPRQAPANHQKMMASRGMNLGPMMRK